MTHVTIIAEIGHFRNKKPHKCLNPTKNITCHSNINPVLLLPYYVFLDTIQTIIMLVVHVTGKINDSERV